MYNTITMNLNKHSHNSNKSRSHWFHFDILCRYIFFITAAIKMDELPVDAKVTGAFQM